MARPALKLLTAEENAQVARDSGDEYSAMILQKIADRKQTILPEMTRFQTNCDRFDNLYYPNEFTKGGADHWADDPNIKVVGKVHVSVNVHPTYVDVPAALQAVVPIENIVPPQGEADLRQLASLVERMYFQWKDKVQYETKAHKIATVKSLYGRAAAKVVWDEETGMPDFSLVENPRNLWLGWRSNDYSVLEWAIYSSFISVEEAIEKYGLDLRQNTDQHGNSYLYVNRLAESTPTIQPQRGWMWQTSQEMIEVNDYWFRVPKGTPVFKQKTTMETVNVITVGNCVVVDEPRPEYGGLMPYVPVFNTYIPGIPDGRSDLYDVEQLLREKDERISNGGTMAAKLVGRQFWQLTGPEAPDRVPTGLRPEADKVVAPGPGNRIEAITPWMPEFQLEAYLARIDRELQDVSGLNDLLRGLAPAQVLSSSKAINALVANYEARITLRRRLFYQWRMDVWTMVKTIWGSKDEAFKAILDLAGTLVVKPPSLTPRDDLEQATMAMNLLNAKVWSQERAMDATGVEDTLREQEVIKGERQVVEMFPADVQAQAQLGVILQQLQMNAAQMAQMQGPQQLAPGQAEANAVNADEARRQAADRAAPRGQSDLNGPGEQGAPAEGSTAAGQTDVIAQSMLMNGQPSNRILTQTPLTETGE